MSLANRTLAGIKGGGTERMRGGGKNRRGPLVCPRSVSPSLHPSFSPSFPGPHRVLRHRRQRGVAWVLRFLVRIVPPRVVAADERPPRFVGRVHIAAVQKIAVKEDRI